MIFLLYVSILLLSPCVFLTADLQSLNQDLLKAAVKGKAPEVTRLLQQGADINARHKLTGWNSVGIAAFYGHEEVVRVLIQSGANVNDRDVHGWTPLMKAVTLGPYRDRSEMLDQKARIVTVLLDAGADPYTADPYGQSVWQMPVIDTFQEIVRVFHQANIRDTSEVRLISAVARNDAITARTLISKGTDINFQDGYGWNSLREAVRTDNARMVNLLIDSGADVNARFQKGWTALMLASHTNRESIVRSLIQARADISAVNDAGFTARKIAEREGHLMISEILQKAGAK